MLFSFVSPRPNWFGLGRSHGNYRAWMRDEKVVQLLLFAVNELAEAGTQNPIRPNSQSPRPKHGDV
jgi:hypothetical protein